MASNYLQSHGFVLIEGNYRCRLGEIDLIVQKRPELHFVEVKARQRLSTGDPLEQVTSRKQQKIIRVAQYYLLQHPWEGPLFFSVLGVNFSSTPPTITWVPDAFDAGEAYS